MNPMLSSAQQKRACAARRSAFALLALALALAFAMPAQAFGLSVTQCTGRPNSDSTNDIMGGKTTRITWQATVDEGESISEVELVIPDGTTFDLDSSRVTLLTGDDLMTRVDAGATLAAEGQVITASFSSPVAQQGALRIEVYNVVFPLSGGDMLISGTYTTSDGTSHDIEDIPAITVASTSWFQNFGDELAEQPWVEAWNSVKFLKLFLNPVLIVTSLPIVFQGFLMALAVVALAFPLAIPVGLLLALMRISSWRVLRGIATTYVNVVRGTPLFLQIYVAFFGLPLAGVNIPPYPLGVIVLMMNSGAYLCEIFRAGIQSINKGQFEASRSLGMNGAQTMIYVIIPQTVRRVIPTMTSEFILLYKDTSLLAAVGTWEIVLMAKTIVASTGSITPYIVAALFYLAITLPLAKAVGALENRLAGTGVPKKKRKKKAPAAPSASSTLSPAGIGAAGAGAAASAGAGAAASVGAGASGASTAYALDLAGDGDMSGAKQEG